MQDNLPNQALFATKLVDQGSLNLQQRREYSWSCQKDIFKKGTEKGCGKCTWNNGSGHCNGACNGR